MLRLPFALAPPTWMWKCVRPRVPGREAGQPKGASSMRQRVLVLLSVLIAAASLAGCTKKTDQTATMTSADSLVATNPTEQAPGNLTPGQAPQEEIGRASC